MQRFASLAGSSSRFIRAATVNHLKNDRSLRKHGVKLYNMNNNVIFQRCLATQNQNSNKVDPHADLYKPSTAKQETHVPDDLKHHHQPPETVNTTLNTTAVGGGKVWSNQSPNRVHVANKGTTFVPTAGGNAQHIQDKTVYTTQGELNVTDPFHTHTLQSDITSAKLAEAEAASAFETYGPGKSSSSPPAAEAGFMPKVSSAEVYSTISSPTAEFEPTVPPTPHEIGKYETERKGLVFGGHDTTADSMKHPKEDPFNTGNNKPSSDSEETPGQQEDSLRNKILCESLKFVHENGWSIEAIRAGIQACNQPASAESLFYNGYDLVEYFMRDANAKMVAYMNELATKENLQGTALLLDGLKYRLKLVIPYASTWEQALAQKGLPPNAKRAWRSLLDLASDAWFSIGDTSTDIKWYTKRLSIATIYRSAEIYMLQDNSPDKINTMHFLERHLGDYEATGVVRPSMSQSLSDTAQVASGLLTVVRTMTTRR